MESEKSLLVDNLEAIKLFLANFGLSTYTLHPLPSDAGFRRYYRIRAQSKSYIVMDASNSHENLVAFVAIAQALNDASIYVPNILQQDFTHKLLLLSDLGDNKLLQQLNSANVQAYYQKAIATIHSMQKLKLNDYLLPVFDTEFMYKEWLWHKEWFLSRFLNLVPPPSLNNGYEDIIEIVAYQPRVFMHRDFHSGNLMVIEKNQDSELAVLDFQDAFVGPITYDLVSLIKDCYISWPLYLVDKWIEDFYLQLKDQAMLPPIGKENFFYWVDVMGIQRHLKALMTFARKYVRDKNDTYLIHMPRTLDYIIRATERYPHLLPLTKFYQQAKDKLGERRVCVQ